MKITCFIDSLVPGGAQRQICTLAVLFKQRGMDVSLLTYHPFDFFLPVIREAGIPYECLKSRSLPQRALAIRHALRHGGQDAVLAFLEAPSFYAELASLPYRSWGLVVSERSAVPGCDRGWGKWRRKLHRFADYVTANSHTGRLLIERAAPGLRGRVVTIYNAIDLNAFQPGDFPPNDREDSLRLAVVASIMAVKNPINLFRAMTIVRSKMPSCKVQLDWYGRLPADNAPHDQMAYEQAQAILRENEMEEDVQFHPPQTPINGVYHAADAVILPSFYEGLSNVVCEAMACGRPVLASNVTDMGNLVRDGENGYVFDPASPEDIARSIIQFARLSASERRQLGACGRRMAERIFDPLTVANRYLEVLRAAAMRKRVAFEHWLPETPASAIHSIEKGGVAIKH